MSVHIYRADLQPAVCFADLTFEPPLSCGHPPDKMIFCDRCDECWPASQMVVQCYYDGRRYWCADGHGCRDKARIAAHAERTRYRRSEAQKQRHASARRVATA